jgi:hypothetical protein
MIAHRHTPGAQLPNLAHLFGCWELAAFAQTGAL